jgi:orotate phosphoribosyltransferase
MKRTENEWIGEYVKKNALFIHDGNPKRPHPLLTSGNHSNGFFNSRLVIPDESLLRDAVSDLLKLFVLQSIDITGVQGVVGPQTGATKLAELLSKEIAMYNQKKCFFASPAKHEENKRKLMLFSDDERLLISRKVSVLCDDVLTTGGSDGLVMSAITNAGGVVFPYILVLVNRSGLKFVNGKKIIALIDQPMPTWSPKQGECPLCAKGSKAVRPKENWQLLNASY